MDSKQFRKDVYCPPLILRRWVGVAHGHLNGGMAEDFFYGHQVNSPSMTLSPLIRLVL